MCSVWSFIVISGSSTAITVNSIHMPLSLARFLCELTQNTVLSTTLTGQFPSHKLRYLDQQCTKCSLHVTRVWELRKSFPAASLNIVSNISNTEHNILKYKTGCPLLTANGKRGEICTVSHHECRYETSSDSMCLLK